MNSDWIAAGRTALLIIDMQVDFAAEGGAMANLGLDMSAVAPALAAAERLARAARSGGVAVVFIGLESDPSTQSPAWAEWKRRGGGDVPEGEPVCRKGGQGAAFFGPLPAPGDQVLMKARYSGFFHTSLDETLRAMGVDTLVVCGLTTECCVDCTVRDAFHLDYHVFVAGDACAAYEPDLHAGALRALSLNCAIVVSSEAVEQVWTGGLGDQPS